mmetsp:Transcript_24538/g.18607  ORF Transcript_24538/g.18607 Transcript_24538/m.18607 type:complete len:133 (+) Transcript_24538:243-641(+)|eukprot:CAMPEP_0202975302 /NCGR_PEP_ID=MMETSP1396-20130829/67918_1 /ASSEMBLY_ACC=CAM_ASM_000872 /TAXON_ID= /ORGANISM="Pseudokeronopsis sp., Strain Brazil" /LENGTH=132 /DNA_ID=CAMNT_0049710647 /DNA_START=259 /DNA_END=657 /DNA_ORIENTATION=-
MTLFLALNGVMTTLMGVFPIIVTDNKTSYYLEILLMTLMGVMVGFIGISLNGTAGPSSKLMNVYMIGIALVTLIIDFMRMVFLAAVPDYQTGSLIFFLLSGLFLIFTAYCSYLFLKENEHIYAKLKELASKE